MNNVPKVKSLEILKVVNFLFASVGIQNKAPQDALSWYVIALAKGNFSFGLKRNFCPPLSA